MQPAPRAHRSHAARRAHGVEQPQQLRQTHPPTEITYAALQQQEEDAETEAAASAAAAASIRPSPYRPPSALAHAQARASDDLHAQLSSLKSENTLLGSIIQQLQLDRQNKAALLFETAQAKEALSARCTALESQLGSESELKDALVSQSAELSQATQALRLLKLSSHRQIAEVCASWKQEVEQVRREKEQELKSLRNRHGAYASYGRSASRAAPRPGSQMQQQRPQSQQQPQHSSQNEAPTRPFSQQSGFSPRSLADAPEARAGGHPVAPGKAGSDEQQQQADDEAADSEHDWDGAYPLHIEERCSMLELALEREQALTLSLRSAALASSQETSLLSDRLSALTAQSRSQLESIQDLQAKLYAMSGRLEGVEVERRMAQSRRVLDQLQIDQPVSAVAPAAVSGAPTKERVAASLKLASASSSLNASAVASGAAASSADPASASALRLLQSELAEERRLVHELRALSSLSRDSECSLRKQLIASTDFSLALQRQLGSTQAAHRSLSEAHVETQARLLRIERDYHRALREVRYANQLLRAGGGGGEAAEELSTPSPALQQQQHQHPSVNPASSSYHALHFAAASPEEDEITQIANAARMHAHAQPPPPPSKSNHHDRVREAAERDRPTQQQQQPSRFQ